MQDTRPSIHAGQVSSHNNDAAAARPACDDFKDANGEPLVGGYMQMLYPAMGMWKCFWIPRDGDHITFLRLPNGLQEGYILGTQYTAEQMPQNGGDGIIYIVSDDAKNKIWLDAKSGEAEIIFDQKITLKCKNFDMEVKEELKIKCDTLKIEAETSAQIKTPELTVEADIAHAGNMSTSGAHVDSVGTHKP
jgi:phage baseplate assembly protein gpV